MTDHELLERSHVDIFKGKDKQWYWRLVAANGKAICGGLEGFHNVQHVELMTRRLFGDQISFKYHVDGQRRYELDGDGEIDGADET